MACAPPPGTTYGPVPREKAPPLRTESAFEVPDEGDRLRRQHPLIARLQGAANDDALEQFGGFGHSRHLPDCARRICRPAATAPPSQNRLQASLWLAPFDVFALFHSRSTGGKLL